MNQFNETMDINIITSSNYTILESSSKDKTNNNNNGGYGRF